MSLLELGAVNGWVPFLTHVGSWKELQFHLEVRLGSSALTEQKTAQE